MPKQGCFLAFDFGTKKIGVAVGQTITQSATPLKKIPVPQNGMNWELVDLYIEEWQPEGLVVGLPLNMDGSEQMITSLARNFVKQLQEHTNLPVHIIDERLTTLNARSDIFDEGGYKALKNSDVDSMAAKIILESWLREHA